MAIFLNQEKRFPVETEEALDFLQIGILFFLIYFGMYYLPPLVRSRVQPGNDRGLVADIGIILLACCSGGEGDFPKCVSSMEASRSTT